MNIHKWGALTVALVLVLVGCAFWIARQGPLAPAEANLQSKWLVVTAALVALCVVAGLLLQGRIDGVLIDDRNRISLSRAQWIAWFIVLLGGYFTEAVWNVAHDKGFPDLAAELLALLGLTSGSAVASNLIVDSKKSSSAGSPQQPWPQPSYAPPAQPGQPAQTGSIDRNVTAAEASWADLYLGEEVANRNVVDISRLQKLVITILLIIAYITWLWEKLGHGMPDGFVMPAPNDKFLWLLGLSHGAYLAYKATPKTVSS